jgi:hypothetical protein
MQAAALLLLLLLAHWLNDLFIFETPHSFFFFESKAHSFNSL